MGHEIYDKHIILVGGLLFSLEYIQNVNHSLAIDTKKLRILYNKNGRASPRERLDQLNEAVRVLDTRSRLDKISNVE